MIDWKKEVARDVIAIGGIPFYLIFLVRSIIGESPLFVVQIIIGFVVLLALSLLLKNSGQHIARSIILAVFSSMYYKDIKFALFAFLLVLGILLSLVYLKIKGNEIIKGLITGIIATALSYQITLFLIK